MPVEYIDSPTGYIGLGETVGLGTITPQRRKRVRKGDKGIFPMDPTGAESYEGGQRVEDMMTIHPYPHPGFGPSPDSGLRSGFAPPQGYGQPYSSIPNVFERYAGLPGGARANPDIPFIETVFPNIPVQPPNDVIEDNNDLDEELRRQTLDIDPYGDYYETQFDPRAPNYSPQAVAERAAAELSTVTSVPTPTDLVNFLGRHGTSAEEVYVAMTTGTGTEKGFPLAGGIVKGLDIIQGYIGDEKQTDKDRQKTLDNLRGVMSLQRQGQAFQAREEQRKRSAMPPQLSLTREPTTTPTSIRGELERSLQGYGTGARSGVTKVGEVRDLSRLEVVSQATPFSVDLRSDIGDIPSRSLGPPSVLSAPYTGFTGEGGAPTVGSTPELGSLASRLADVRSRQAESQEAYDLQLGLEGTGTPDLPSAGPSVPQVSQFDPLSFAETHGFGGAKGGQVSFMGMKK